MEVQAYPSSIFPFFLINIFSKTMQSRDAMNKLLTSRRSCDAPWADVHDAPQVRTLRATKMLRWIPKCIAWFVLWCRRVYHNPSWVTVPNIRQNLLVKIGFCNLEQKVQKSQTLVSTQEGSVNVSVSECNPVADRNVGKPPLRSTQSGTEKHGTQRRVRDTSKDKPRRGLADRRIF